MRIERRRSRGGSDDDRILPLINVVFLLLIFFMVAGQFGQPLPDDIAAPVSTSDQRLEAAPVSLRMDRALQLTLNDRPVTVDGLGAALAQLASEPASLRVVLKADRTIRAADLDAILAVLRAQGIARVTLQGEAAAPTDAGSAG